MQIYYFTRTGRSEEIADKLAVHYGSKPQCISDGKDWSGVLGYIKAGFMATTGKVLPATYPKPTADEPLAVVFPVWAGTFPPAVRSFIGEVGRERLIAIPTSLGSKLKDRECFVKVIDLVGQEITAPYEL